MDFAPYQSSPPEHGRVASPDYAQNTRSPRASLETAIAGRGTASPSYSHSQNNSNSRDPYSYQIPQRPFSPSAEGANSRSPPPLQHPQPQRGWTGFDGQTSGWGNNGSGSNTVLGSGAAGEGGYAAEVSEFDTSLGLRLDYEACLAYLALPPLGAIVLLILERNSDYVRFHAWQSALLFTAVLIFHIIISWSRFLSWFFFVGDVGLIAFLTLKAYRDAEILDRFEVPFFGRIASRFLDDE